MELKWIEDNYDRIIKLIKSYNDLNDVIFIGHNGVFSELFTIYNIDVDENDCVARKPVDKNKDLYDCLISINYPQRERNLRIYEKKGENKI